MGTALDFTMLDGLRLLARPDRDDDQRERKP